MKHLKEYEEQDIKDLMGDMKTIGQDPLKGWIVSISPFDVDTPSLGTKYYAITADNVKEAYAMVSEDWIYEDEDLVSFVEDIDNFTELSEKINDSTDQQMGFVVLGVWEGLRPISKESESFIIDGINPFEAGRILSQKFSNAQSVMTANPKGNTE
jgi:hypothetical protein